MRVSPFIDLCVFIRDECDAFDAGMLVLFAIPLLLFLEPVYWLGRFVKAVLSLSRRQEME